MRRTWTLVLILALLTAMSSWLCLPSSGAAGVSLAAPFVAYVCSRERRGPP